MNEFDENIFIFCFVCLKYFNESVRGALKIHILLGINAILFKKEDEDCLEEFALQNSGIRS